jgi:hypothetical protein
MDLGLAMLQAVPFYILHNAITLWINAQNFPWSQLWVNSSPTTNVTLITYGI